jgi:hypothetical protein
LNTALSHVTSAYPSRANARRYSGLSFSTAPRCLSRPLLANVFGDALVEGAVAADHEYVVVRDGAEGLILHGR